MAQMKLKLERFPSGRGGSGLRALQQLGPGHLLYSGEPLAFCVSTKFLNSTCHCCFSRGKKLLRCSGCKCARYCDAQCQKLGWPEHRSECRCLKRLQPKVPTDSVRLSARIIFTLLNSPEADAEELYPLHQHQSHEEDLSEQQREGLDQLCAVLQLYLQAEFDVGQLTAHLQPAALLSRVMCNSFSISDGELQDIGVGLYPSMSLLNHDCQPNCVMVFVGKTLQLRAVRDIQPYEELTISYTDVLAPRRERQTHLSQQYHFTCQCHCCSTEDGDRLMLAGDEAAWTFLRDTLPHLEKLQSEQQWEELQSETQTLLSKYTNALPDTNVYLLRLLDMAMDTCISLDQYSTALQFGTRTLAAYKLYYSTPHPCLALELLRVAKLQHFLGRVDEADHTYRQAHEVLQVSHGSDHSLLLDVRRKLSECQAELARA